MSDHLIERDLDESRRLSKRHNNQREKKMKGKEVVSDTKEYNRMRARGEILVEMDNSERDIFVPVQSYICNLCGRGFKSVKAKKEHVEDNSGPHGDHFEFWCRKPRCGCVYETDTDLLKHQAYHDREHGG